ncbi:FecR family protein [Methyloceanibacter stevinii]|uniref:FecR family protein n=1 Tax=Methyloceanibacter stevinii TaxID=1774970 RepID=UPI001301756B|nr:FecR domain-containing protein [Methyloceanibacter stevinii]
MTLPRSAVAIALLCSAGVGLALSAPAYAAKVGVAAAVNPDAFSSLSGVPNKQLNIGKSIFYNERIETTAQGLVQVLLVDGSTFTVGPNSNLVIDKFVYDPNKKTGELVATFSKGSMRFIGGKLSKNAGGVKVNTPSGALAIRGGMFQGNTQKKIYSFLYGHSMSMQGRNGRTQTVYQPGYTLDLSRGGSGTVRPTTAEDTAVFARALTSRGGSTASNSENGGQSNGGQGGSDGGSEGGGQQQAGTNQLSQSVSIQDMVSSATSEAINNEIEKQIEEQKTQDTPPPTNTPAKTPTPTTTTTPPAPPPEIDARIIQTAPNGIATGDFNTTFQVIDRRLVADLPSVDPEGCEGQNCEVDVQSDFSSDFAELDVNNLGGRPSLQFDFPETLQCVNGFCPVTDAKVIVDGETVEYFGGAVIKPGFFAYQVARGENANEELGPLNALDESLLIFGGKKHNFQAPSGKIYVFALTSDVIQQSAAPFASAMSTDYSTPDDVIGVVTPLLAKEQNTGAPDDQSRPVWLQSTFALGTGESSRQSFVNIALGEWSPEGGIQGSRRGGSDLDGEDYSFTGDIASLEGPDGGHFLGADDALPNAVLTLGGPGTENAGRDTPLNGDTSPIEQSGATYHVAAGTEAIEGSETSSGTFTGFAAGFSQRAGNNELRSLVNNSADEVVLELDSPTNTLTASVNVGDGRLLQNPRYSYQFGGEGNSALISDNVFGAIETPGESEIGETTLELVPTIITKTFLKGTPWETTKTYEIDVPTLVDHDYTPDVEGYIVSADALGANEVLFAGQTVTNPADPEGPLVQRRAFCQDCDFIKWGAWGTRSRYTDHSGKQVTEDTHLGWWIAGDVVPEENIDRLQELQATALYEGDAIGTVAKFKNGTWNQSVARGDMTLDWKFAKRSGDFSIKNFDNRNFGGKLVNLPGTSGFSGIVGKLNTNNAGRSIVGSASGSFVGFRGLDKTPKGVIGNFDVHQANDKWRANGIFGGTQRINR